MDHGRWVASAFVSLYGVNVEFGNLVVFATAEGCLSTETKLVNMQTTRLSFFKRKSNGLPKLAIRITTSELAHYVVWSTRRRPEVAVMI